MVAWQGPPLGASGSRTAVMLALIVVGITVHELLHGLGFLLGGVTWRQVRFAVNRWLCPYACLHGADQCPQLSAGGRVSRGSPSESFP